MWGRVQGICEAVSTCSSSAANASASLPSTSWVSAAAPGLKVMLPIASTAEKSRNICCWSLSVKPSTSSLWRTDVHSTASSMPSANEVPLVYVYAEVEESSLYCFFSSREAPASMW